MFKFKEYNFKRYSYTLLILVALLTGVGAYLIKLVQDADANLYQKQVIGLFLGIFVAVVVSLIDYHFLCRMYILMYLANMVLLLMVKFLPRAGFPLIASRHYDAQRWLKIQGFEFQPSELSKVILIIFMAQYFSMCKRSISKLPTLLGALILMGVPTYLIFDQPHLSTTIVLLFVFAVMYFSAGLSYKVIAPILLIGVPAAAGLLWYVQQDFQVILTPWQQNRILSLIHPNDYPDLLYQQINSVQAIGSGQLYGKLLTGDTGLRGTSFVPVVETDFIFSVVGEELGFLGSCVIIGILVVIIVKCIAVAKNAPDFQGMLIATGISSMFMIQLFVNVGVATQILPNTGTPFPFLSYGLSSLISAMISIGVILNIKLQTKKQGGKMI